MKITYCDLCDCPVHGKKYVLMILTEEELKNTRPSNWPNVKDQGLRSKEICETCYKILSELFRNRKKGLTDLVTSLEKTFKMTCKKPKKKK